MSAALEEKLRHLVERDPGGAREVQVSALQPLSGGNARQAWAFDVTWWASSGPQQRNCVLLSQVGAGQLEQALGPEFRVLEALGGCGIAAPRAYWLDEEGSVLAHPGFVMERVAGETSLRVLLDPDHGSSRDVAMAMAETAAALHRLDTARFERALAPAVPETVALEQVAKWERLFLAHRMEPLPLLADAFRWLREHAPRAGQLSLLHGDFRFGNVVYRDGELGALLDWEMTHLGDPCEDLTWAYRALWSPATHLSWDAFLARYADAGGPALAEENILFYQLFGEVKHAVISVTGAHSFAVGKTTNLRLADRMTWVPECLAQFLEWCPEFAPSGPRR